MNLVRVFQLAAVVFAAAAIYLAFTDRQSDYLFTAVILAACSGFLSYRFLLKNRIDSHTADGDEG